MASAKDQQNFFREFEALKAKYGESFADLQAVRFKGNKGYAVAEAEFREFTPYWCRADDNGFITCEKERPV